MIPRTVAVGIFIGTIILSVILYVLYGYEIVSTHPIILLINSLCLLIAFYIDKEMKVLVKDVKGLSGFKYEFKKV